MFLLIHVFLSTQHEALSMVIAETFYTTALSHLNMLYTFLYTIFTTVHIQWIRNISIDKPAVYAHPDYACVFIFSVYGVLPSCSFFIWFIPSFFSSQISTIFFPQKISWLWPDYYHCRTYIACLLLCTKTIPNFYAKVICFFMGCIQRHKRLRQGLDSYGMSIFPFNIINK